MKSHIAHYVTYKFNSKYEFFSKKIEKYIKSQEYKANSVNIIDMYIQLYNKTKTNNFIYNKEKHHFIYLIIFL